MKLLKWLFSVENSENKTHKVITILGIKLKFKMPLRRLVLKQNKISNQLNNINNQLNSKLDLLTNIYIPAMLTHKEVFAKYKNCHKGENIVIVGAGPSLNYFEKGDLKDSLYIGTNRVFKKKDLQLNYFFAQDYFEDLEQLNLYQSKECKCFYGHHYIVKPIGVNKAEQDNAERYYFIDRELPEDSLINFSSDITTRPLSEWSSVIFAALEFALWTNPTKIYIVGCDLSGTHFDNVDEYPPTLLLERMKYGWKYFKKYQEAYYPNVEMVAVNPVWMKGMFKDVYTKRYIEKYPELKKENVEILR